MPPLKSRTKLLMLFSTVKNDNVRFILGEIISLESEFRSMGRFPQKRVNDTVDNEAHKIELGRQASK